MSRDRSDRQLDQLTAVRGEIGAAETLSPSGQGALLTGQLGRAEAEGAFANGATLLRTAAT